MGDGPEEEHDADGTEECAHHVHHLSHLSGIAGEMCEEIAQEHEERCPWWVTDFLLVGSCNKLRTVPETGCRLNRGTINKSRNDECDPSKDIVHQFVLFHYCLNFNVLYFFVKVYKSLQRY